MPQKSIHAILFDFGGVLAEEGFRNGLMALAREQGLDEAQMPTVGMQAVYDSGFVVGQGKAADFWQLLRQRSGLQGDDASLSERILEGFIPRPWMLQLVMHLKTQGYITGILSDQTNWLDLLDRRHHLYQHFDHIYNSYYLGKGKRDPSLFRDIATTLRLAPEAILFIDDDAGNVARARQAKLQAIHYVDKASFLSELNTVLESTA